MTKPLLKAERAIALDPNNTDGYVTSGCDILDYAGQARGSD